jgi:hypothetical protein
MRPEFILPVLLLLLLLVLVLRRQRAKSASPAAAPQAPAPVEKSASANVEALFTIQVWELGVIALGFLLLAAHVAVGAPPLVGGPIVMLAGAGAVVVRTKRSAKQ